MITLSMKLIKEIAVQMDMGFSAFLHKETHKLIFVPDMNQFYGMDLEAWEEDFEKLKKDEDKYIEIARMKSCDTFRIMKDFAEQVDNTSVGSRLLQTLERRSPFKYFKDAIDNSGDYRELWFAFKHRRNIEWVEDALNVMEA